MVNEDHDGCHTLQAFLFLPNKMPRISATNPTTMNTSGNIFMPEKVNATISPTTSLGMGNDEASKPAIDSIRSRLPVIVMAT